MMRKLIRSLWRGIFQEASTRDPETGLGVRMREDWNQRAREDAMHYIMTDKADWSYNEFMATGEEDIDRFLGSFLSHYGNAEIQTVLELGCGIGRLTIPLARRFPRVDAIDISDEMIARAKELHKNYANVRFMVGNGRDLANLSTAAYDLVFSYIVLQHIPESEITYNYFREFARVLRVQGYFLFQVATDDVVGHHRYLARWEERRQALLARNETIPFEDYDHAYLASKIQCYETIVQTPVDLNVSLKILSEAGLRVDLLTGPGTAVTWMGGQKVGGIAQHSL